MEYSGAASFYFLSIFFFTFSSSFLWYSLERGSIHFQNVLFFYFWIFFYFFLFWCSSSFFFCRSCSCLPAASGVLPSFTEFYRVFFRPPHPSRSCGSFTEFFFNFYRVFSSFFLKPTPTAVKKKNNTPAVTEFYRVFFFSFWISSLQTSHR